MDIYQNFAQLIRDKDLENKPILFWVQDGLKKPEPMLKRLIGFTYLNKDMDRILLHLVSADYDDPYEAEEKEGVSYVPFDKIVGLYGFETHPDSYYDEQNLT